MPVTKFCANPDCGREFVRLSNRQKYCGGKRHGPCKLAVARARRARKMTEDPEYAERVRVAGRARTRSYPLYGIWACMNDRCHNPRNKNYLSYGGRGICVFPSWRGRGGRARFVTWIETHLGPRPKGRSLDRIDNDGSYVPGNLRWATPKTQSLNRRPRRRVVAELQARIAELEARLTHI